jgi:hypothetical protein
MPSRACANAPYFPESAARHTTASRHAKKPAGIPLFRNRQPLETSEDAYLRRCAGGWCRVNKLNRERANE